jgi:hypothetical protein
VVVRLEQAIVDVGGLIMSLYLITTSIVTVVLIPAR